MFKAKIKSQKLKDCCEAIGIFTDNIILDIMKGGVSIKSVDDANVGLVQLVIPVDSFDGLEASECQIGIDIRKLGSVLEMAGKEDIVDLSVDEKKRKLNVRMGKLSYDIRMLDPSNIRKTPNVSGYTYATSVTMLTESFITGVKGSEKVSDYAYVGVKDSVFYIEANGDTESVRLELGIDKLVFMSPVEARSIYSLDYLSDMVKIAKKAETVTLDFSTDYPLKLSFRLDDNRIEVSYILSPRVESQ